MEAGGGISREADKMCYRQVVRQHHVLLWVLIIGILLHPLTTN
jgi:hypothetical protein